LNFYLSKPAGERRLRCALVDARAICKLSVEREREAFARKA